ncbi:hypothetical protein EB001_09255 [bacterium]|nr:hypothetical protein [bacterium]
MGHDTLANHIKSNFNLIHHHKWNLGEIDGMMPWEKHIYVELLNAWIKEQEETARQQEQEHKSMLSQLNRRRM